MNPTLTINLNQIICLLNKKVAEGLIPEKYAMKNYSPSFGHLKLSKNLCFFRNIPYDNFYVQLTPKVTTVFNYISSYPEDASKVIYKNMFNSFEIIYLIQKLTRFQTARCIFKASSNKIEDTVSIGKMLAFIRLSILEYLGCEYFGNTDPELSYSKKDIQKFAGNKEAIIVEI